MSSLLTGIAAAAGALFAGGALYVSAVEHPARLACGPPMALAQFRRSYPRGAVLQGSLAVLGGLAGAGAWLEGAAGAWALTGLILFLVVPFTFIVIMPTNRRLLDPTLGPDSPEARHLLGRWGLLHLVRTAAGLCALALMLRLLVG